MKMSEKRFFYVTYNLNQDDEYYEIIDKEQKHSFNFIKDEWLAIQVCDLLNKQHTIISQLKEENKQLKCINDQTDKEMTNMECLLLLIPFVILFVLLTGIIIAFLVQLGWVVI